MDRLTTDNPSTNLMTALNLFYAKDGQAWVRGGGPEPDYKDCTLNDYIWATMKGVMDPGAPITRLPDEETAELMADWLMDGHCCISGLIAHLYTAGWAFAELRARLKDYEDTGGTPQDIVALREKYGIILELNQKHSGATEELEAAKRDIAALLWLNGNCEYCKHGRKEEYSGASRWTCALGSGADCYPEWRGKEGEQHG